MKTLYTWLIILSVPALLVFLVRMIPTTPTKPKSREQIKQETDVKLAEERATAIKHAHAYPEEKIVIKRLH